MGKSLAQLQEDLENARGGMNTGDIEDAMAAIAQYEIEALCGQQAMPICPICKSEMWVNMFEGFYDTFKHWECNCSDLPKEKTRSGGAYCE
jgi:hypothetical protein